MITDCSSYFTFSFTGKNKAVSTQSAKPSKNIRFAPFNGVTTFTADYVKFPYAPRQPLCKPPSSEKPYDLGPFDGRTTQSLAYKSWPVFPLETPPWAVKPVYKRPHHGGMPYSSTYTVNKRNMYCCQS